MTLKEAVDELVKHAEYTKCAKLRNKQGAKLRMFRVRFSRGLADTSAMIDILESFKYVVEITVVKKPDFLFNEDCEK